MDLKELREKYYWKFRVVMVDEVYDPKLGYKFEVGYINKGMGVKVTFKDFYGVLEHLSELPHKKVIPHSANPETDIKELERLL